MRVMNTMYAEGTFEWNSDGTLTVNHLILANTGHGEMKQTRGTILVTPSGYPTAWGSEAGIFTRFDVGTYENSDLHPTFKVHDSNLTIITQIQDNGAASIYNLQYDTLAKIDVHHGNIVIENSAFNIGEYPKYPSTDQGSGYGNYAVFGQLNLYDSSTCTIDASSEVKIFTLSPNFYTANSFPEDFTYDTDQNGGRPYNGIRLGNDGKTNEDGTPDYTQRIYSETIKSILETSTPIIFVPYEYAPADAPDDYFYFHSSIYFDGGTIQVNSDFPASVPVFIYDHHISEAMEDDVPRINISEFGGTINSDNWNAKFDMPFEYSPNQSGTATHQGLTINEGSDNKNVTLCINQNIYTKDSTDGTHRATFKPFGDTIPVSIVLYDPISVQHGSLYLGDGTKNYFGMDSNDITLSDNTALVFYNSGSQVYDGQISGPGRVEKRGSGDTQLNNSSDYTGGTLIKASGGGSLSIGPQGSLATNAVVTIHTGNFNQYGHQGIIPSYIDLSEEEATILNVTIAPSQASSMAYTVLKPDGEDADTELDSVFIYIYVYFDKPVTTDILNPPILLLSSGISSATYDSGRESNTLIFKYDVQWGEHSELLDYKFDPENPDDLDFAWDLENGGLITSMDIWGVNLDLPLPGSPSSLANSNITVDTSLYWATLSTPYWESTEAWRLGGLGLHGIPYTWNYVDPDTNPDTNPDTSPSHNNNIVKTDVVFGDFLFPFTSTLRPYISTPTIVHSITIDIGADFTIEGNSTLQFISSGGTIDVASDSAKIACQLATSNNPITKTGKGKLRFTADDRGYNGEITIAEGTLQIDTFKLSPSDSVFVANIGSDIKNNSKLEISVGNGDVEFRNSVSGSGAVIKDGAGYVTITEPNTYEGGTIVKAGALIAGGDVANHTPFGTGGLSIEKLGKVVIGSHSIYVASLAGSGSISGSSHDSAFGTLTIDTPENKSSKYYGYIGDPWLDSTGATIVGCYLNLTKIGLGTQILALDIDANDHTQYTGHTTIKDGILQFARPESLPNFIRLGHITVNNGGSLAVNVGGSQFGEWTETQVQTLLSYAAFDTGSAIGFDTTNAIGGKFTYQRPITGKVALTKMGFGRLTLTRKNNTYSGNTTISGGTLELTAGANLNPASTIVPNRNCELLITGSDPVSVGNINGAGTVTARGALQASSVTCGVFQFGQGYINVPFSEWAARIEGVTASSANGFYQTDDTINIQVNFDRSVSVTGSPKLRLSTGAGERYAAYQSGSGSSTLTFAYTVQSDDFSFDLDYANTDAIALEDGTIQNSYGVDSNLGLVAPSQTGSLGANSNIEVNAILYWDPAAVENGSAVWDTNEADTYWHVGSPTGPLHAWVNGTDAVFGACGDVPGTVYVEDYEDPNGPVTARSITFLQSGYVIAGATVNDTLFIAANGMIVSVNGENDTATIACKLVDAALRDDGLTKTGEGKLVLTGAESYTGDTVISEGTLQLGDGTTNGSLSSNIVNNAKLKFAEAADYLFDGDISGSGTLTVENDPSATLTLSGNLSYSGNTTVNGGVLKFSSGTGNTPLIDIFNGKAVFSTTNVTNPDLNIHTGANGTFEIADGSHVVGDIIGEDGDDLDAAGTTQVSGQLTAHSIFQDSLNILADSTATLSLATSLQLRVFVNHLNLQSTTSTLDLSNAGMIITNAIYDDVLDAIHRALNVANSGWWDGAGITSSVAKNDPNGLNCLGLLTGEQFLDYATSATQFLGKTITGHPNWILIRPTVLADSNFSGATDDADYGYINYAYGGGNISEGCWMWGDYNYDGTIDADDYGYIDAAYGAQYQG